MYSLKIGSSATYNINEVYYQSTSNNCPLSTELRSLEPGILNFVLYDKNDVLLEDNGLQYILTIS